MLSERLAIAGAPFKETLRTGSASTHAIGESEVVFIGHRYPWADMERTSFRKGPTFTAFAHLMLKNGIEVKKSPNKKFSLDVDTGAKRIPVTTEIAQGLDNVFEYVSITPPLKETSIVIIPDNQRKSSEDKFFEEPASSFRELTESEYEKSERIRRMEENFREEARREYYAELSKIYASLKRKASIIQSRDPFAASYLPNGQIDPATIKIKK